MKLVPTIKILIFVALLFAALLFGPQPAAAQTPPATAQVTIYVFDDENKDGELQGGRESIIDGLTVQVYTMPEQTLLAEKVTSSEVHPQFYLPSGTYLVSVEGGEVWEPTTPNPVTMELRASIGQTYLEFGFYALKPLPSPPLGEWLAANPGAAVGLASFLVGVGVTAWAVVRSSRRELGQMETAILAGLGAAALYGFVAGIAIPASEDHFWPFCIFGPAELILEFLGAGFDALAATLIGVLFWGLLAGVIAYHTGVSKWLFTVAAAAVIITFVGAILLMIFLSGSPWP